MGILEASKEEWKTYNIFQKIGIMLYLFSVFFLFIHMAFGMIELPSLWTTPTNNFLLWLEKEGIIDLPKSFWFDYSLIFTLVFLIPATIFFYIGKKIQKRLVEVEEIE